MTLDKADDHILDLIYEAAFIPERWISVLRYFTEITESASTGLGMLNENGGFGFMDEYNTRKPEEGFWIKSDFARRNFIDHARRRAPLGFTNRERYFPRDYPDLSQINERLTSKNIGDQLGATINLPTGEVVCLTSERWLHQGTYHPALGASLDIYHPHLTRSVLLSARLGGEKPNGAVSMLDSLGMPAAMLSIDGKMIEANQLMHQVAIGIDVGQSGVIRLAQRQANAALQNFIYQVRTGVNSASLSIPLFAGGRNYLLHALPISGTSRDLFYRARALVIVTEVSKEALVPSLQMLVQLYGLTASEARLARTLAAGRSLQDCAAILKIGYGTARSYLLRIFRKTNTGHQAELVALIKSIAVVNNS